MNMKETLKGLKSNKSFWGGLLVVVIIVVLIIVVGPKEAVPVEEENTNEETTALSPTQSVKVGDYEYAFSGVEWIFDTEDPLVVGTDQTYLKMMFADFTRNGNAITFGRPYKLGFHPGTCKEVDFLDTADETGLPISYAECTDGKITRQFAVFQESEKISVKMNEKTADTEATGWQDWYTINIAEIVK